jgi:hypothetical protein
MSEKDLVGFELATSQRHLASQNFIYVFNDDQNVPPPEDDDKMKGQLPTLGPQVSIMGWIGIGSGSLVIVALIS